MSDKSDIDVICSFCGKSQDEVKKLIAGPSVYICDECIDLCNEIVSEDNPELDKRFTDVSFNTVKETEVIPQDSELVA